MQEDFHYYATYCAAYISGYNHEESQEIAYSAQFVDCLSETLLKKLKGPIAAATTQTQPELMNARTDIIGLQNITRIWTSFHFLPYDLYAKAPKWRPKVYMDKYRLICKPNGELVRDTVCLARDKGTQAVGVAMHVLADTWAHSYFAGTPSNVINNTNYYFYEILDNEERKIGFKHNPSSPDNLEKGQYSNSLHQENEHSIMNLGHGRAGHLPDYSFIKYKYLPAWGNYEEIIKDNQVEYYNAFCQMVYAMRYLRGEVKEFELDTYAYEIVSPWEKDIKKIIKKRQLLASEDWKRLGEKLSGEKIEEFDVNKFQQEYIESDSTIRQKTFLGLLFRATLSQKSMVTSRIFRSKNLLAGFSKDYIGGRLKGIKDFWDLIGNN